MVEITVNQRKIPYGNTKIELNGNEHFLHTFQEVFYSDLSDLLTVTIVVAPTGAGKTFAFILPIVYAKQRKALAPPRGLIVVPTNALVEDIYNNFKEVTETEKLTGSSLQKYGIERPKELLKKLQSASIVVTNPDIVNFVIHGGYHIEESGKRRHILNFSDWTEFFGKIDYVIFDEFHLYDEEQIANILVWLLSSQQFFKKMKWFFVSATPEPVLLELLKEQKLDYKIVKQALSTSGRVIQEQQIIHFVDISSGYSLYKWMFNEDGLRDDVKNKISKAIEKKKKVFLLFNSLREAKIAENKIKNFFPTAKIGVNTGFETRQKDFEFDSENYDVIITTSKAEVGVNYPIQLAYIDSGKYLKNFLQRIGRIGRREKSEIYCATPVTVVEKIKKYVNNGDRINYYEFVTLLSQSFEDIKHKKERIPIFMGAILWSIQNALKSYDRKQIISELVNMFPYSKILFKLDELITKVKNDIDEDIYENLKIFWNAFKKSFRRFRDDSLEWKIFYKNQETEYDIIWVFDNAFIEEIDRDNKKIIISDFRPKREKIVRGIYTWSLLEDPEPMEGSNLQKIGGDPYKNIRKKEWTIFQYSDYIGNLYNEKLEKWLRDVKPPSELEDLLKKLSPLYSKKRIEIVDVFYDSGEIKDVYII
jgi:CRISPR-associated endonuclease/helicase Cas3